jgi:hypothetical protein
MSSTLADYLRKLAGDCRRWQRECFDLGAAKQFRAMGDDLLAKAVELERSTPINHRRHGSDAVDRPNAIEIMAPPNQTGDDAS